ncbi:MAG TPA: hypothetical protein VNO43_10110 [Candidatus Eisenbacteria bacterium]|nr:hypothetical protein [Candidatus Eisenbacteria bacterium]
MSDSVVFATGARGSGKSSWLKQYARGFGRVLVWSPVEQTDRYADVLGVLPCDGIGGFVSPAFTGRAVCVPRYPTPAVFDMWCKIVWHVGDCLALVDELADVTPIGKAVGWWGSIVRKGRHRGITVAAGAQRPAEIDKTIIGNCTRLVCFRLARARDRAMMADELSIDRSMLDALAPLQFLDADMLTGKVTPGRLVFR